MATDYGYKIDPKKLRKNKIYKFKNDRALALNIYKPTDWPPIR